MSKSVWLLLLGLLAACTTDEAQMEERVAAAVRATLTAEAAPRAEGLVGTSAQVLRVIDGDTLEVRIEGGQTSTVRYIGINAPELGDPCGAEASQANAQFVAGRRVTLMRDISEADRYGRLLRYVYWEDLLVNAELVRLGYASAATYPPDVAFAEEFARLEAEARASSRGCWAIQAAAVATEEQAQAGTFEILIDPNCSLFDAPGNDNQNREEEYVCFTQRGAQPIDLTGWSVRDDHGWTYSVPVFSLAPGASVRLRTGCGVDTDTDLYWCKPDAYAVWNNAGDTVTLLDPQGVLIARYSY